MEKIKIIIKGHQKNKSKKMQNLYNKEINKKKIFGLIIVTLI